MFATNIIILSMLLHVGDLVFGQILLHACSDAVTQFTAIDKDQVALLECMEISRYHVGQSYHN